MKLDPEEKELLEAYESGQMKLETPSSELLKMLARSSDDTFKKGKRINIPLSSHDLQGIQRKAAQKGIPYQALISGLIHQYVEGDLVEKDRSVGAVADEQSAYGRK